MYFTVNEDELTGRPKAISIVSKTFQDESGLVKISRILESGKACVVRVENEEEFVEIEGRNDDAV